MKVLVIEPHKKPYEKDVDHTLESLQGIVGGLIEPIYFDDSAIIVNEEGKINGLPFNRALRDENKRILDLLFGTFFICGLGEEDFTDIPEQAMGISKAYYKDNVTAFILLSSDSDFWGVISSLPDADFLVMVEEEKCGSDIQNALEQDGTYYCFMDDFCTGNIKTFKNAMFVSALKDEMWKALAVDTQALIDDIIRNLRMDVSASEKSNFYNKYIRKMRLEIDDNGILKIKVQEE